MSMSKKKCPFRKRINYMGYHDGSYKAIRKQPESTYALEEFEDCIENDCSAWDENEKICNLCSSKRVFNVEARCDTRYDLSIT